jgi:hypothetical protein
LGEKCDVEDYEDKLSTNVSELNDVRIHLMTLTANLKLNAIDHEKEVLIFFVLFVCSNAILDNIMCLL